MRISELASSADVSVATVKFYLRERLLPEGRLTSATQAQYGEEHVERLRLIRALLGPGGLSIARAKVVLAALDAPPPTHQLLGVAHGAVSPPPDREVDLTVALAFLRRRGWYVDPAYPDLVASLALALDALTAAGFDLLPETLEAYADAAYDLAEVDVAHVPTSSPAAAVRYVVLGTVLMEPLLLALRRLAQEEASRRRYGSDPEPVGGDPATGRTVATDRTAASVRQG